MWLFDPQLCSSLHQCLCPPVLLGANSVPTGIPNLGFSEEGKLYSVKNSSIVTQQGCEVAPKARTLSGQIFSALFLAGQLCSTLVCFAPCCSAPFHASPHWPALLCSSQKTVFGGKGKRFLITRRELTYIDTSLCPWSPSTHANVDSKSSV